MTEIPAQRAAKRKETVDPVVAAAAAAADATAAAAAVAAAATEAAAINVAAATKAATEVANAAREAAKLVAEAAKATAEIRAVSVMQPPPWPRAMVTLILGVLMASSFVVGLNTLELIGTRNVVQRFNNANVQYILNHERTQRLTCAVLRGQHLTIPADPATNVSDCAGR